MRTVFDGESTRSVHPLVKVVNASEAIGSMVDPITLVSRALMAAFFLNEGFAKIRDFSGVAAYMRSFGVWPELEPLVVIAELGGGLLILLGLATRLSAMGLAIYTLLAAFFFHTNFADADQFIHFQKNLTIAGGFLALSACGAGVWSLDAWIVRRRGGL